MLRLDLSNLPVASSETARHLNRGVILNLIREKQPVSRADLARLSGLQRSTVSLITEDLIGERWVVEGTTRRLPRGRRPTFLLLNRHRRILCIDIRPSQTLLGISDVNGVFSYQEVLPTDNDPARAIRLLLARIRPLMKNKPAYPFEGIGVSVPGRIDTASQKLVFAPNLGWPVCDLKTPLVEGTGLEVVLENAANACALAEMWFGRDNSFRNLVAVTVSEGIGTGIVIDGRLVSGQTGTAGEFGHFPLEPDGPECSCGNHGCWEVLASNRAAIRYYYEAASRNKKLTKQAISFVDLLALADEGDAPAAKALDRMAVQLARGVRMIIAGLAPEAILFVGEFTAAWKRFEPYLKAEAHNQSIASDSVVLLPAMEIATARLRGTVAMVLQKHFGLALRV